MDCITCNKDIEDVMLDIGSSLCEFCFDVEYQDYLESVWGKYWRYYRH